MSGGSITRRVFVGSGAIALAGVVSRLVSMPANPFLTSHIAPHGYGLSALVATTTGLASVFGLVGMETSYARFALDSGKDPARIARFCWRFALVTSVAVGIIAGILFAATARDADRTLDEQLALGVVVSFGTISTTSLTLANVKNRVAGKYGRVAIALISGSVCAVASNVLLTTIWRADGWVLITSSILNSLVTLTILGVPVSSILKPSGLGQSEKAEAIKLGAAVLLTAPSYWVIMSSDRWVLAHYLDESTVGVYNFGVQFGMLAQFVPMAVSVAWLPEIARFTAQADGRHQEAVGALWEKVASLYVLTWAAVSMGGGDLVRFLSAPSFHQGAKVVPFIAAGVVANGFAQLGMSGFFMGKQFRGFWGAWVAAAVLDVTLNVILVPQLGILGAAISNALAMASVAVFLIVRSQAIFPLHIRWRRLVSVASPAILLGLVGAHPWHSSALASLLLKLPFGLALSAWTMVVIAPEWAKRVARLGRQRPGQP